MAESEALYPVRMTVREIRLLLEILDDRIKPADWTLEDFERTLGGAQNALLGAWRFALSPAGRLHGLSIGEACSVLAAEQDAEMGDASQKGSTE